MNVQTDGFTIAELEDRDIDAALRMHAASSPLQPFKRVDLLAYLSDNGCYCYGAMTYTEGVRLLSGFAVFVLTESHVSTAALCVHPVERDKGIGSVLLSFGKRLAKWTTGKRVYANVRDGDRKTERWYESRGFDFKCLLDIDHPSGEMLRLLECNVPLDDLLPCQERGEI